MLVYEMILKDSALHRKIKKQHKLTTSGKISIIVV